MTFSTTNPMDREPLPHAEPPFGLAVWKEILDGIAADGAKPSFSGGQWTADDENLLNL